MIYWLEELGQEDLNNVGKKCANLGEMTGNGLPIPPGFAVSVEAYRHFMQKTGLTKKIGELVVDAEAMVDRLDKMEELSRKVRSLIESFPMTEEIEKEILTYYRGLSKKVGKGDLEVAVRSSGVVSMPGSYETYLYVSGEDILIDKIIKCWSSTFNARSIAFRLKKNMNLVDTPIGVAVIKMVNAEKAGVLFTVNPLTGDRSKMVVEANWGLGESVVSGRVGPDRFRLNRITATIEEKVMGPKEEVCIHDPVKGGVVFNPTPEKYRSELCLTDKELLKLLQLGKKVESVFGGVPQDIEWAFDKDLPREENLLLLQARPEQTYPVKQKKQKRTKEKDSMGYISSFLSEGIKLSKSEETREIS